MGKVLKNFIELTEIQFTNASSPKSTVYKDYIRPTEIAFMETIKKENASYTKIHFAIGTQKFDFFAKETPEEIDELIEDFYKQRKSSSKKKSRLL